MIDDDARLVWRLTRTGPLAWRLRMRAGLVLYVLGLQRLGALVAGVRLRPVPTAPPKA